MAPDMIQTRRTTRLSSMPEATDRSRLSDTARIAVPSRAFCRNRPTATSVSAATTAITRSLGRSDTGPSWIVGACAAYCEYCLRPGAVHDAEQVAQAERQTDRHDHLRDDRHAASAQRPIDAQLEGQRRRSRWRRPRRAWPAPAGVPSPPASEFRYHATIAPKVSSSPWAKFVRPVVPKISDSPTAASAMTSPNRIPLASRLATRSTWELPPAAAWLSVTKRKMTERSPVSRTRGDSSVGASSAIATPSGNESSVSVTSYWPAPGTATATTPSDPLSAEPISSPSRVTTISTPSTGSRSSPTTSVATIRGAPVGSASLGAPGAAAPGTVVDTPGSCAPAGAANASNEAPTTTASRTAPRIRWRCRREFTGPHCRNELVPSPKFGGCTTGHVVSGGGPRSARLRA